MDGDVLSLGPLRAMTDEVRLDELEDGMELLSDIVTNRTKRKVLARGVTLDERLIGQLRRYDQLAGVQQPILVRRALPAEDELPVQGHEHVLQRLAHSG